MRRSWMVFLLTPVISYAAYPAYEGKWGYTESKTNKSKKSNTTAGLSDLPPLFVEEVDLSVEENALAVEAEESTVQETLVVVEMEVTPESAQLDEGLVVSLPVPAEQESEVAQNEELEEQEAFLARMEEFVALEEQEVQVAMNEPALEASVQEEIAAEEADALEFYRMQQMLAGYEEASPRDFIGQSDENQNSHVNPEKSTRTKQYSPRVREPLVRHRDNANGEGAGSSSFSELGEEFENAKRPSISHRSGSLENADASAAPFTDALSNESLVEGENANMNSEANEALEGAKRPTITHRKSVSVQSEGISSGAHSVAVQEDDSRASQEKPYHTPTYTPPHYQAPPDPRTKSQREAPETSAPTIPKPETPKAPEVQRGNQLEQGKGSSSEYGQRMHPQEERKTPAPEKSVQGAQSSEGVEKKQQKAPVAKKQNPQQKRQAPANQAKPQKNPVPMKQAPVVDNTELQPQKAPVAEKKSQRYQRRQVKEKAIAKNDSKQKKKHDTDKNSKVKKKNSSSKKEKKKNPSTYGGKRPSN